jgi:hypothetical protein
VKRAHKLIYTAERQASRDVGLAGLRLKPGSSQKTVRLNTIYNKVVKRPSKQAFPSLLIRKHRKIAYKSLSAKVKTKVLLLNKCLFFK